MQAALVEVFLGDLQSAVGRRALDGRVLAVQHDVVVDVDALSKPGAACLAVWALDHKLVEHCLDDLRHGTNVLLGLNRMSARRTSPLAICLRCPGMIETLPAKVVVAGELDGLVEGRVADEVAVGRACVFEVLDFGRYFRDTAESILRRG
jgi:hypothetical protein